MELEQILSRHGQSALLAHLNALPDGPLAHAFRTQLESVDWARLEQVHAQHGPQAAPRESAPPSPVRGQVLSSDERVQLWHEGLELLAQGKAAFVLMAGGQGSRLGYEGPKGACPLGLPGNWTLFEYACRRLERLGELTGRLPRFLVMTSPENDAATRAWFAARAATGRPSPTPLFFIQSTIPALDDKGQALLAAPGRLALVPDGNGGIFESLQTAGLLDLLQSESAQWLHVAGVDNILSLPCDPVFLAFAQRSGKILASKSVLRREASEKVGVFADFGAGRTGVAEYIELDPQEAGRTAEDDLLVFREANIASHLIHLDAAQSFACADLPWHLARKAIAHIDATTLKAPHSLPLSCKYERFIFDAFPGAGGMAVLRVERADEFAPVKNAQGEDSPITARQALEEQSRRWKAAWGEPLENPDEEASPLVDPLVSYAGER